MNEYFSTKACNTLMLNILNKTNTLLGAWRVDDKDTYIFFPEDIGYIGMMLTRGYGWLVGMERDAREYLRDFRVERHPDLPNVSQWDDYIRALSSLPVPCMIADWQETKDMLTARDKVVEVCKRLRGISQGIGAPHRAKLPTFLGEESDRAYYKVHVLNYKAMFMDGRVTLDKELKAHWAGMYEAIRVHLFGLDKNVEFYGPDWDAFILGYCGIEYHKALSKRSRYHRISEIWDDAFGKHLHPMSKETRDIVLRAKFDMARELGPVTNRKNAFTGVPKMREKMYVLALLFSLLAPLIL